RMTQFKDKTAKREGQFISAGLFTYPALQAADILLYDTNEVPVGDDQRQHVEITRDVAIRFNHRFGDTFVIPEAVLPSAGARVMDLQDPTSKMSKSASSPTGIVEMLDDPKRSAKKIRSAVTDSGTEIRFDVDEKPGVSNLITIYSALTGRTVDDLVKAYDGRGYGDLKKDLADVVVDVVTPFRDRTLELLDDRDELEATLRRGADRAREVAGRTLADVYDRVGFVPVGR
ncbi:MAG TPA: tryptophan--tRNA ligase, partial [Nocardioidaceae bacterium]|nr:tryptophan--tRNA ligase [Nocardioidaceae bacterium]